MQADSNGALRGHIYFNYYSHYLHPSSSTASSSSSSSSHPLPSSGEWGGDVKGERRLKKTVFPSKVTPSHGGVKIAFDLIAHYGAALLNHSHRGTRG